MVLKISGIVASMIVVTSSFANTETFNLKIGDFQKEYPIKQPQSGASVKIAYVNDFADNLDLLNATAAAIAEKIRQQNFSTKVDVVAVPGDKANALGALVVNELSKDNPAVKLVIFRTSDKGGNFKSISYQSVTSKSEKKLYAREDHYDVVKGKQVIVLDDVISSGATVKAAADLVRHLDGKVIGYACGATEGERDLSLDKSKPELFDGLPIFKVTHFPLIKM